MCPGCAQQEGAARASAEVLRVVFEEQGKLGISFGSESTKGAPPVRITKVAADGLAAKDSRIVEGLEIRRIADVDCSTGEPAMTAVQTSFVAGLRLHTAVSQATSTRGNRR